MGKSDDESDLEFQISVADGPAGASTEQAVVGLGGGTSSGDLKDHTFSDGTKDTIYFYLHYDTNTHSGNHPLQRFSTSLVRVNGLANTANGIIDPDYYFAFQMLHDTAVDLGWDSAGVVHDNVLSNSLPLDWLEGHWADMFTYLASTEDWRWRCLDDWGSGPYLEYGAWGTRTWTAYAAGTAMADNLTPLEVYNQIEVRYPTEAGATGSVVVDADPTR